MMKKIFAFAILFAAVCSASLSAGAQAVRLGVRGGLAASWIPGAVKTSTLEKEVPHNNFYAGIYSEVDLGDIAMGEIDVLYTGKGYSSTTEVLSVYGKTNLNISYIRVPLLAGVRLGDGRFSIMAGPDFGFALGGKLKYTDNGGISAETDIKDYLNVFNLGIVLQGCVMITDGLGIDVKFDWGATRTFNTVWDVQGVSVQSNAHNIGVNIGLCYKFEL